MNLNYGIRDIIPDDAVAAWGARAILRNGVLDIVWDRVDYTDAAPSDSEFLTWMNHNGLPWVREQAEAIPGNENKIHRLDDGPFHIACNAQASHGYLYISAWRDET